MNITVTNCFKKVLVGGISLVLLMSSGAGFTNHNVSAHHNSYHTELIKQRNHQYKSIEHYIHWVSHYNKTHTHRFNSWKVNHLFCYMDYLTNKQSKHLLNQLAKINRTHTHSTIPATNSSAMLVKPVPIPDSSNISSTVNLGNYTNQGSNTANNVRADLINDLNQDRENDGLRPLTVTTALQRTADYRNPKVKYAYDHQLDCLKYEHLTQAQLKAVGGTTDNWIHGEDTHTSGYDFLNSHNYNYNYWGANAGTFTTSDNTYNYDGSVPKYSNRTASGMASNIEDVLMNHDTAYGNNNGHRDNILNPMWKYVGIGVTMNGNNENTYDTFNEQFGC